MHQVVMQPMNSHLKKNPRDDHELGGLSSFSTFEEKNQEMMRSWEACRHLLHLKKKTKKQRQARKLVIIFYT
jgi:hypothetical protein